ncbi:hypothetical protein P4B35_01790 [Pontiellaceae bacterium B12227]|nr:hypothetical protein [Pontiellaceae bacterium B12227]
MMNKKIGIMMASLAALAASAAQGAIQLDGGSSVSGSITNANGGRDISDSYALTDGGSAVSLAIGETFNMGFTIQTLSVDTNTPLGTKIGYGGTGWALNDGLKLGFGDGAQALALQFQLKDFNPKLQLGGDSAATSAGDFKFESGSAEITSAGLTNAEKLKFVGDTATFNLTVDHTAANTFDMTLDWGGWEANYAYTSTVDMASVSDFYVRINDLDVNLGYEITIIPGQPTSTNPPVGNVEFAADWEFRDGSSNMAVLASSADGFSVEMTNSLATNDKRFMYQMDANSFDAPFQVGETATWSFTAGAGSTMAFNAESAGLQGSMWDSGIESDNAVSFQIDWGAVDTVYMRLGSDSVSGPADIGSVAGAVDSVGTPSTVINGIGQSADFVISMTRTSLTDVVAIMSYDDLSVTNDLTISANMDSLNELGFRFRQTDDNALIISNMKLVISNPNFEGYDSWATDNGLTAGVNDGLGYDAENGGLGDGMNNLLEYALGGDPLVDDADVYLPKSEVNGGFLHHVYNRQNPADPKLTYTVLDGTDLVTGGLDNTNTSETVSAVANGFETVTNTVSTATEGKQFMKLKVELAD